MFITVVDPAEPSATTRTRLLAPMHPRSTEASAKSQDLKVPVAVIASGIAAGALFAIAVTVGWVYWGKSVRRAQLNKWRDVETGRKTKLNTEKNAVMSNPSLVSFQPLFARPTGRKVSFVAAEPCGWESASLYTHGTATPTFDGSAEMSKPRLLRPVKGWGCSHLPSLASLAAEGCTSGPLAPPRMAHKASAASSSSMYSTASGEEHQVRVPPNLILAATGNGGLGVDGERDRRSVASSSWSFLSRVAQGVHGNIHRYSEASMRSSYSTASKDSSGAPIGVAL